MWVFTFYTHLSTVRDKHFFCLVQVDVLKVTHVKKRCSVDLNVKCRSDVALYAGSTIKLMILLLSLFHVLEKKICIAIDDPPLPTPSPVATPM